MEIISTAAPPKSANPAKNKVKEEKSYCDHIVGLQFAPGDGSIKGVIQEEIADRRIKGESGAVHLCIYVPGIIAATGFKKDAKRNKATGSAYAIVCRGVDDDYVMT